MLPPCSRERERGLHIAPMLPEQHISGTFFGNRLQRQFIHHPEPSDPTHNHTFGEPEIPYPRWLPLLVITLACKLPQTTSDSFLKSNFPKLRDVSSATLKRMHRCYITRLFPGKGLHSPSKDEIIRSFCLHFFKKHFVVLDTTGGC